MAFHILDPVMSWLLLYLSHLVSGLVNILFADICNLSNPNAESISGGSTGQQTTAAYQTHGAQTQKLS